MPPHILVFGPVVEPTWKNQSLYHELDHVIVDNLTSSLFIFFPCFNFNFQLRKGLVWIITLKKMSQMSDLKKQQQQQEPTAEPPSLVDPLATESTRSSSTFSTCEIGMGCDGSLADLVPLMRGIREGVKF